MASPAGFDYCSWQGNACVWDASLECVNECKHFEQTLTVALHCLNGSTTTCGPCKEPVSDFIVSAYELYGFEEITAATADELDAARNDVTRSETGEVLLAFAAVDQAAPGSNVQDVKVYQKLCGITLEELNAALKGDNHDHDDHDHDDHDGHDHTSAAVSTLVTPVLAALSLVVALAH